MIGQKIINEFSEFILQIILKKIKRKLGRDSILCYLLNYEKNQT
jgi:hypothetical protein